MSVSYNATVVKGVKVFVLSVKKEKTFYNENTGEPYLKMVHSHKEVRASSGGQKIEGVINEDGELYQGDKVFGAEIFTIAMNSFSVLSAPVLRI